METSIFSEDTEKGNLHKIDSSRKCRRSAPLKMIVKIDVFINTLYGESGDQDND